MNLADITFVVLTKNEAARISGCLASIPAGAAMVVYDSSSTDGTVSIAERAGARVVNAPWRGFAQTRLDAAALVGTAWTFMLDADERLSAELVRELEGLQPPADVSAYSMPRRNYFCGRWIRGAGWWPDRLVRLFRTGQVSIRSRHGGNAALHETWEAQGATVDLHGAIEHDSYASVAEYRAKFERYTDIEASAAKHGASAALGSALLTPLRAAWLLLGRGAVRDGWRGAFIAWNSARYPAVVAAKARRIAGQAKQR